MTYIWVSDPTASVCETTTGSVPYFALSVAEWTTEVSCRELYQDTLRYWSVNLTSWKMYLILKLFN